MEKEKEARERGETKDTRSFLAKYVRSLDYSKKVLKLLNFCYQFVPVDVHCASGDFCPDIVGGKPRSGSWRRGRTMIENKLHTHSLKKV
jgi:hypothetical protein